MSSAKVFLRDRQIANAAARSIISRAEYNKCSSEAKDLNVNLAELKKIFFDDLFEESFSSMTEKLRCLREASWLSFIFSRKIRSLSRWAKAAVSLSARPKWQDLLVLLNKVSNYRKGYESFVGNQSHKELLGSAFNNLNTNFDQIDLAISTFESNREAVQKLIGMAAQSVEKFLMSCDLLRDDVDLLRHLLDTGPIVLKDSRHLLGLHESKALDIRSITVKTRTLVKKLADVSLFENIKHFRATVDSKGIRSAVEKVHERQTVYARICEFQTALDGIKCDFETAEVSIERLTHVENLKGSVEKCGLSGREDRLINLAKTSHFIGEFIKLRETIQDCLTRVEVDQQIILNTPVGQVLDRIEYLQSRQDCFQSWMDYCRSSQRIEQGPFISLLNLIETRITNPDHAELAVHFLYTRDVLNRHVAKSPSLKGFRGDRFEDVRKKYRELDRELLVLNQRRIASDAHDIGERAAPAGRSSNRKADLTELSLLENEMNKETRHIPIRQLMVRAQRAVMAYKPCFMMSPLSVAQFLPLNGPQFDLVVMDEASQITMETALGSLARGRQIVVVGDSKQLPPTSFFDSQSTTETDDTDQFVVDDTESILQHAASIFQERLLKWHYRSEHESLIAFSNAEFYRNELVLFPSPIARSDDLGVHFRKVEGIYLGAGVNQVEASEIVRALKHHAVTYPHLSIGVATMNKRQKDEIDALIERESKEDPFFRSFLESKPKGEEYFVKNLENVQGDERDVILISVTYGKDSAGVFHHRFGPINSKYGARRLNVLFSRARMRMDVFCSFSPEDLNGANSNGAQILQRFLVFARDGILEVPPTLTGRPPDSDFERSVASFIEGLGFEVIPQLGVAGYFLDIAIRDPNNQGRYLVGIECDGATYHSSKSARDRDRLRQQNLEKLGWSIHRIWSTDWFKTRWHEENRLRSALEGLSGKLLRTTPVEPTPIRPGIVNETQKLRQELLRLRHIKIGPGSPDVPSRMGILRTEIIDLILEHLPSTEKDFIKLVTVHKLEFDGHHSIYILEIIEIISRNKKNMERLA